MVLRLTSDYRHGELRYVPSGIRPSSALVCVVDTGVFVHNLLNDFLIGLRALCVVCGAKAFI